MYCQQETPDLETSPHLSDSSPRGGNQTKQHWWQLNTITKKQTHLLQQTDALLTVSYLNKQSSVSQRMNQGDQQTERGSQPPALPSKQQAVITQAKSELMKMGTGTGASHQLKDLCTDRSSMLWIKSRTSGLTLAIPAFSGSRSYSAAHGFAAHIYHSPLKFYHWYHTHQTPTFSLRDLLCPTAGDIWE